MYLAAELAIRKQYVKNLTRPGLFKLGGLFFGSLSGIQVGFWRLRNKYRQVDVDGTLQAELQDLFKNRQSCPISKEETDKQKDCQLSTEFDNGQEHFSLADSNLDEKSSDVHQKRFG